MVAEHDPRSAPVALVGRDRERQRLRRHLDTALAGHGSVVLISGEAGVGKTALADDLCQAATVRGACAIVGHCYDLTETPPYGPWSAVIARYRAFLPQLPDAPAIPIPDFSTGTSQSALFAAFAAFLTAAAAQHPLVLLLEDCHWSDAASLDLLRFLARTVATLPVLLLVTFRGDELTPRHPLYVLVPLLERESAADHLEVRRLDRDAVRALIAERYPLAEADATRLVAWLNERAGGNAFFTTQLLHALAAGHVLRPGGGQWVLGDLAPVVVPLRLRQVIETRALRLDEEAHRLLAVAALIGHEVPFRLWCAMTKNDEETLFAVAEAAIAARLIEATADGAGIRFVHALVREALVEGILPFRRRGFHQHIGQVLAALPDADPDAVAYHYQRAGDERAVGWLMQAGERAERTYAWLTAADRFVAAAALVEHVPTQARLRSQLLVRVALLHQYSDISRGVTLTEEAINLAEQSEDATLAALATFTHGFLRSIGTDAGPGTDDRGSGLAEMEAGIAALDALPASDGTALADQAIYGLNMQHGRAILVCRLAACGRFEEARIMGERVGSQGISPLTLGAPLHDPEGLLYSGLGLSYAALGRLAEARTALADARTIFRRRDQFMDFVETARLQLGWMHFVYTTDDLAERQRLVADITEGTAKAINATGYGLSHLAHVATSFLEGEWHVVLTYAPTMLNYSNPIAQAQLAEVALAQGEHERAWKYIRSVFPQGPPEPAAAAYRNSVWLIRTAGTLALDTEDLVTARIWLEAHDRWQAWSGVVPWRAEGELLWARYERMLGQQTRAKQRAERALALASEPRQPLALLAVHRTIGELDTEAGHHTAARDHLETALALADVCRAPYERALTLLAMAELHAATGATEPARAALDDARAICLPLSAQPALDRADALAARLETVSARSPLPARLTGREAEVLRFVAEGLTNAQVAERLFLSPRTVDFHLRSIYGKLGVSSRAAATRFALEHHLD